MIDELEDDALQTNASDPAQQEHARWSEKEALKRRREVWRRQLSTGEGREFVWMLLRDCGFLQHIGGSVEAVYGQAALHNQVCAWVGRDIAPHPELGLQMQMEARKRAEQQRRGNRTARARKPRGDSDEVTT